MFLQSIMCFFIWYLDVIVNTKELKPWRDLRVDAPDASLAKETEANKEEDEEDGTQVDDVPEPRNSVAKPGEWLIAGFLIFSRLQAARTKAALHNHRYYSKPPPACPPIRAGTGVRSSHKSYYNLPVRSYHYFWSTIVCVITPHTWKSASSVISIGL